MTTKPKNNIKIEDISDPNKELSTVEMDRLVPLPPPYDKLEDQPGFKRLKDETWEKYASSPDGVLISGVEQPKTEEEEKKIVEQFISGLEKLFSEENNWAFLQPLMLSMEHCARCQTCVDDCPIYEASGYQEVYRPTYRSEVLRRLYNKYVKKGNKLFKKFQDKDIHLNFTLISRLFELSYRCTLCRRCAQSCPIGVDNGLITHELRKLFSMEMGWAPKELHEKGTVQQLEVGSSTGMNALVVKDNMEFIDEDMTDRTGIKVETQWDKEGADVLIIHNAGEILAWPENPGAFAIMMEAAGISWTMSSELAGYDGVNYGLFYDDVQLARIALKHLEIAKKLGVKKIVLGECGHETKTLAVIADRIAQGVPRENAMTFIESIVNSGKLNLDPSKNDFPVTLHDPCNMTRIMGIVEPQRRVLRKIAPQFREMTPHGVRNYCCGGGSGFAIMSAFNFQDWRMHISGRKKFEQILNAFSDTDLTNPDQKKYICAPCSNCKGQIRDILDFYGATEKSGIYYGGLVELVVNAMEEIKEPFIDFEMM
ncbi:MAG: (Fe-S)-binding protein [Candidatus Kapaibacterium sp.]